ncbi:MAG: tetratricopeptide repeat protein [Polyangiales bacterium]
MEAQRYEEACQKFAESYRLDAAAGTLLNLAVCHEKVGKIASAWGEFRQALFDAKKAGRPDREALAKEHIDVLEPDLPYLTVEVPTAMRVSGLEVVRNGSVLHEGGWGTELPVDPGDVEIVGRAPGFKPRTWKIKIEKKEHKSITLQPLAKAPVPVMVVSDPGWSTTKKIGLGLMGVGVAGLGLGTYFGLKAIDAKHKSDDACPVFDGERRCGQTGVSQMSSARTNSWLTDVAIGVGLGSAVVGTYLFVTGGNANPETPKRAQKKVDWSIAGGPNGVSGVVFGVF